MLLRVLGSDGAGTHVASRENSIELKLPRVIGSRKMQESGHGWMDQFDEKRKSSGLPDGSVLLPGYAITENDK